MMRTGLILGYHNPNNLPLPAKIPDNRVFVTVPLEHSRKPLLLDLVRPLLTRDDASVLELFARFVPRGDRRHPDGFWLSVGNEGIKFNEVPAYWRPRPSSSEQAVRRHVVEEPGHPPRSPRLEPSSGSGAKGPHQSRVC